MIFVLLFLLNLMVPQTIDSEAFIQVTRFLVPQKASTGDSVRLSCLYELSGETLHAMKLFKDEKEFYRYTPTAPRPEEQKMAFRVPGVTVDLNRSNGRDIFLRKVTPLASGSYKCQVSVEHTFRSISAEKRMEVGERSRFPDAESLQLGGARANQAHQQHQLPRQQSQHYTVEPVTSSQQLPTSSAAPASIRASNRNQFALITPLLPLLSRFNSMAAVEIARQTATITIQITSKLANGLRQWWMAGSARLRPINALIVLH